jgi:hypothetical protein
MTWYPYCISICVAVKSVDPAVRKRLEVVLQVLGCSMLYYGPDLHGDLDPFFDFASEYIRSGESLDCMCEIQLNACDLGALTLAAGEKNLETLDDWSYGLYDFFVRQEDIRFFTNFAPSGTLPEPEVWAEFMGRFHDALTWGNCGTETVESIEKFMDKLVDEDLAKGCKLHIPANAPFAPVPIEQLTSKDVENFARVRNP